MSGASSLFNLSGMDISESSSDDEEYQEEYNVQQESSIHSFVWNANKSIKSNNDAHILSTKPVSRASPPSSSTTSTSSSPLGFLSGRVSAHHMKNPLDGIFPQQQQRITTTRKDDRKDMESTEDEQQMPPIIVNDDRKDMESTEEEQQMPPVIVPHPHPDDDDILDSNMSTASSSVVSHVDAPKTISSSAGAFVLPDSVRRDSLPSDSVRRDSLPSDSVRRDSLPSDSIRRGSLSSDGTVKDLLPSDAARKDTLVSNGAERDFLQSETLGGDPMLSEDSRRGSVFSAPTPVKSRRESLSYREVNSDDPPPPPSNIFQPKSSVEDLLSLTNKERRFSITNTSRHHDYNDDPLHGYVHEDDNQVNEGETKEMVISVNVNMSPSGLIASHVPLSPQQRVYLVDYFFR